MIEIIKEAHTEHVLVETREFRYKNCPTAGCSFDWKDGKPVFKSPEAEINYQWCLEHPEEVNDLGFIKRSIPYKVDTLARCECGREIWLNGNYYGSSQCPYCGRWHNLFGQTLNPPEMWGEDVAADFK